MHPKKSPFIPKLSPLQPTGVPKNHHTWKQQKFTNSSKWVEQLNIPWRLFKTICMNACSRKVNTGIYSTIWLNFTEWAIKLETWYSWCYFPCNMNSSLESKSENAFHMWMFVPHISIQTFSSEILHRKVTFSNTVTHLLKCGIPNTLEEGKKIGKTFGVIAENLSHSNVLVKYNFRFIRQSHSISAIYCINFIPSGISDGTKEESMV